MRVCCCRYFCYVKQEMAKHMLMGADDRSIPMSPPGVVTLIRQSVPDDTILCLDNGLYKVCCCCTNHPPSMCSGISLVKQCVSVQHLGKFKMVSVPHQVGASSPVPAAQFCSEHSHAKKAPDRCQSVLKLIVRCDRCGLRVSTLPIGPTPSCWTMPSPPWEPVTVLPSCAGSACRTK